MRAITQRRTWASATVVLLVGLSLIAAAQSSGTTDPASRSAPPAASSDGSGATVLLDRIASIVDDTLAGKSAPSSDRAVGTTGNLAWVGKVTIERQQLDEIRAEVAQLKSIWTGESLKCDATRTGDTGATAGSDK